MRRLRRFLRGLVFCGLLLVGAFVIATHPESPAALPTTYPHITRHPATFRFPTTVGARLPAPRDPNNPRDIDLRWTDLARMDVTSFGDALSNANFDSATKWPAVERMPRGFEPARVAELGKDPGLGVRSLHARGITGKGIAVAVIDQPTLVEHREFADRLRLYEDIGFSAVTRRIADYHFATMHGCATASIAVGRTVGVAPEAELYYMATTPLAAPYVAGRPLTMEHYATAIRRVLAINETLPAERKIRAISLSIGWTRETRGFAEIESAVAEARRQNVLVTSSSLEQTYGFKIMGMGRAPMADPNDFASWRPGRFVEDWFLEAQARGWWKDRLLIPMDHRTAAGPGAVDDYAHYASGGLSWCTPYLAGVYALACQADPRMTPEKFWAAALRTGRVTTIEWKGKPVEFGPMIDPVALIDSLKEAKP
jgi:hypothetical protein